MSNAAEPLEPGSLNFNVLLAPTDAPAAALRRARRATSDIDELLPSRAVVTARAHLLTFVAALADLVGVVIGYAAAAAVRPALRDDPAELIHLTPALFLTAPLWPLVFAGYRLYDRRRLGAPSEEARRLFHAVTLCVGAVVVVTFFADVEVARGRIAALWGMCLLSVGAVRLMMRDVFHRMNSSGLTATRTLVVGANEEARAIARTLERQRWRGYRVAGFIEVEPTALARIEGKPVLGRLADIAAVVERIDAGAVVVAGSAIGPEDLMHVDHRLQAVDVEIRVSPGLPNLAASRLSVTPIDGLAMLALHPNRLTRRQVVTKRAFDLVGAVGLLVLAAPVMALIALSVRLSGRGGVLFRQVRVGAAGSPFVLYKFRTMVPDAELHLDLLHSQNQADGVLFKMVDDPRVTSVGRVLRRLSLDELPQLFNVIRGEMSLVGPRPALARETERYSERLRERLRVKPGLTGLWQVNGRHELPFDDYERYDLFYVENWSLSLDLYILAKTVPALFGQGGGAY